MMRAAHVFFLILTATNCYALPLSIGYVEEINISRGNSAFLLQSRTSEVPNGADVEDGVVKLERGGSIERIITRTGVGGYGSGLGPDGNVWVLGPQDVRQYRSDGTPLGSFLLSPVRNRQEHFSQDIAVGPNGEIYVAIAVPRGSGTYDVVIQRYDSSGNLVLESGRLDWFNYGANRGSGGAKLKVDSEGNVYIANRYDVEVAIFNSSLAQIHHFNVPHVNDIRDFAVAADGSLYFSHGIDPIGFSGFISQIGDNGLLAEAYFEDVIPVALEVVPTGSAFSRFSFLAGVLLPGTRYSRIYGLDDSLALLDIFAGNEPGPEDFPPMPVTEPSALWLSLAAVTWVAAAKRNLVFGY
jgi:hypothetical protein